MLFSIKSPEAPPVFLNYSFRSSFCSIYSCFCLQYPWIFDHIYPQFFLRLTKNIFFSIFWFSWISYFYNITIVILTISSIASCLLFWSVHHTSMDGNFLFAVFRIFNELDAILINCLNCLFGTKANNTLDACW